MASHLPPASFVPPGRSPGRSGGRRLAAVLLILAGLVVVGVVLMVGAYAVVASELPSPGELRARTATFRSMQILDRDGNLLNETFDPDAGRRTVVPLDQISPFLVQATIATEDVHFYQHRGVDPLAIARAVWYAIREKEIVSGASTIPQQLVKQAFLTSERTMTRKVKEAVLAAEISRRYTKDEILELYLNEIFYGNLAYGARAAADTYFKKDAKALTLAEASLLAGLPQAPAYYDPYTNPERARRRQAVVLNLMVEAGFVTREQADAAQAEAEALVLAKPDFDLRAPHFTLLVREQIESLYGPDALYKLGLNVTTTLDSRLQAEAEAIVREQVDKLATRHVTNGALVALRPESGEIVAFVGSKDFGDEAIAGQVNMATAPRQPGSAMKPFVYLAAFEQPDRPAAERWTPGTLVADVRTEFPDGANPPYVPVNYDGEEHGLVTVRAALANSYNVPAVKALQTVGIPAFLDVARRAGITTLTRPDYGLSLALGGGEVPLVELTGAFAVLATGGYRRPPVAILKVTDAAGAVVCDSRDAARPCRPGAVDDGVGRQRVIDPVDAFLITDILSDNEARVPAFGASSPLQLNRPAAVKTGTTNDYRDNLTVGFTPQIVAGVWVGNADNSPMRGVSGVAGAGPIWNAFMTAAHRDLPAEVFGPPPGAGQFEVCRDTGTQPGSACPETRVWWFASDRPPLPPERDLWQRIRLDRRTGQRATGDTPEDEIFEQVFKVFPPELRAWAEARGTPQPPPEVEPPPEDEPTEAPIETPTDAVTPTSLLLATATPTPGAALPTASPVSPTVPPTIAPATATPKPTAPAPTLAPRPTPPPVPTEPPPTPPPEPTLAPRPTPPEEPTVVPFTPNP